MRNTTPTAEVINSLLRDTGRSIEWLSGKTGISVETLSQPLSLLDAAVVADALGVDLPVLTSGITEPMLTVKELAAKLKKSPDTIYRHASQGIIPAFKIGGAWRFYLSKVIESASHTPARRESSPQVDTWERPARSRKRVV